MENNEKKCLSFKAGPISAVVITIASLFCQWLNWAAFEHFEYPWVIALFTPIVLCIMYHFVQLDSAEGGYPRKFVYIFSAVVPLIIGIIAAAAVFLRNPDISSFNPEAEYNGTVPEIISIYSGRFVITSLYLVVFGIIDIPFLNVCDRRRSEK